MRLFFVLLLCSWVVFAAEGPESPGKTENPQKTPVTESDPKTTDQEAASQDEETNLDDAVARFQFVVVGKYLFTDMAKALKTPTATNDVPQSLSIVTADQIDEQDFNSLGEIIDYIPGIHTAQGEGHHDELIIRGSRSTGGFFVDGVRDDGQYYRALYNLEQVEILRGPNALLFGRGGTGGILNRVTKKGRFGQRFTTFRGTGDSFGAFSGRIDSNIGNHPKLAFRINAFYDGLQNHRDFFDGDRIGFNPTLRIKLNPATTLDLSYEYSDHRRFIDRGIPTGSDGRPVEAFEEFVYGDQKLNQNELISHLARARLEHLFSEHFKGNLSAFYGDYDKDFQNFFVADYQEARNIVRIDGSATESRRQNTILAGELVGEFNTGGLSHAMIVGIEYVDTVSDNIRYNAYFDTSAADVAAGLRGSRTDHAPFSARRPIKLINGVGRIADGRITTNSFTTDLDGATDVDIEVISVYFQDEIRFSEQFLITFGARYDRFDTVALNVPLNEAGTRTDEEISPRLGVVYKPQPSLSLYSSYSESFQPRSGPQIANINSNANRLDPNSFSNIEAGVKWDITRNLTLTASVFEVSQEAPVVSDADAETFDVIESSVEGAELQLQGQLTDRWFITAGGSYQDGRQEDGMRRPRDLPENLFSLWNNLYLTNRLSVGLGLTHQAESFLNNRNRAVLPSYTRVDAAAYYDIAAWRIQLNLENLTDALYFPNASSTHQVTVGAPLNAQLSLRGRF